MDLVLNSGVTRGLSQGGKRNWKAPTGHCKGTTSQHLEKNLRNDGESGWGGMATLKPLNHPKILRKIRRDNNLLKTKRILKPKYKPRGCHFIHFFARGVVRLTAPHRQLRHWFQTSSVVKCSLHVKLVETVFYFNRNNSPVATRGFGGLSQGRPQGGLGLKSPLELDILQNFYYLRKGN